MKMVNTLKQNKLFLIVALVLLSASFSFAAKQNTYATKTTPVGADKVLIADSADSNKTKQANINAMRSALGLDTTDNPSFLSLHASGGNLAAANKQVTKAWATGLPYTANLTSVIYGGKHYICTSTHTAGSTTEPGVGASWATVWSEVSGSGSGDNLGSAAYSDVVALWTTCTGYLKNDGSCDIPSGTYTSEIGQDMVGAMITGNTETGISVTYDDADGTLDFVVATPTASGTTFTPNGSIASSSVQAAIQEVRDEATGLSSLPTATGQSIASTGAGAYGWVADTVMSANATSFVSAANYADMRTSIGLVIGTDVQAYNSNLATLAAPTAWRMYYSDGSSVTQQLAMGTSGKVLKSNGASAAPSWEDDSTAAGAGYVSTPPTYSDSACTAGQYALSESYRYDCVASGNWNRTTLTDWTNLTPTDTIPAAFTFTDVTNATISTAYTDIKQITGIDAGITCTGSGGTVAACTGSTEGTCGTFGGTSGTITNNQYVGARITSSGSTSTAVNNVVTCGTGSTSDTFTVTTGSGTDAQITAYFNADANTNGQAMTKGTGVTANTADFTAVAAQVGNGLQNGTNYYQFQIPTASNVTGTTGTMGFYWRASSIPGESVIIDGGAGFTVKTLSATQLEWYYKTTAQTMTIAVNTWYFVEVSWDGPNNVMAYRVNGGSWTQVASTGTSPTIAAQLAFGNAAGNAATQIFDQLMFSSVYQKDLYAVRTSTNP
jgi:hypothetical protein